MISSLRVSCADTLSRFLDLTVANSLFRCGGYYSCADSLESHLGTSNAEAGEGWRYHCDEHGCLVSFLATPLLAFSDLFIFTSTVSNSAEANQTPSHSAGVTSFVKAAYMQRMTAPDVCELTLALPLSIPRSVRP